MVDGGRCRNAQWQRDQIQHFACAVANVVCARPVPAQPAAGARHVSGDGQMTSAALCHVIHLVRRCRDRSTTTYNVQLIEFLTFNMSVPPAHDIHPFLRGNFAPVTEEYISHSCDVVHGRIPPELYGGQYIRNGGNPVYPPEKGRHYHW